MATSEKMDASLNLALQVPEEAGDGLRIGFEEESRSWRVIVRYVGDIRYLAERFPGTRVAGLLNQYAVLTVPEQYLEAVAAVPEIIYVENPKRVYFVTEAGRSASCINSVQGNAGSTGGTEAGERLGLSGRGVLVGIVDSGECVIILLS